MHDNYSCHVLDFIKSDLYERWFKSLRDAQARARIEVRIRRLGLGNPGDVKAVGQGILEMRINYGPGYRVYFMHRGPVLVILLCGGDKSGPVLVILLCGGDKNSQDQDIALAKMVAAKWKE